MAPAAHPALRLDGGVELLCLRALQRLKDRHEEASVRTGLRRRPLRDELRALKPLAQKKKPQRTGKREDYRLGVEVYMLGSRERVHGDANDDMAVLAALRDVLTREGRFSREKALTISDLASFLADKVHLLGYAMTHAHELFGPAILERKEFVMQHALQIVNELHPEPQVELPALDERLVGLASPPSAYSLHADMQRHLLEQHKQDSSVEVDPRLVNASWAASFRAVDETIEILWQELREPNCLIFALLRLFFLCR